MTEAAQDLFYPPPSEPKGEDRTFLKQRCEDALRSGTKSCVWLLFQRGARVVAKDVPMQCDEEELRHSIYGLREAIPWWKRYALYSAVGITEVEFEVIEAGTGAGFEVIYWPTDNSENIAKAKEQIECLDHEIDPGQCWISGDGELKHSTVSGCCANWVEGTDWNPRGWCKVEKRRDLRANAENMRKHPLLISFYWTNKASRSSKEFLRESCFLYRYENLKYKSFQSGNFWYGGPLRGFIIVEGWRIHYLVSLLGFIIAISVVAVAIGTAVSHDFDTGLTVGSYVLALGALLLATLTGLSQLT